MNYEPKHFAAGGGLLAAALLFAGYEGLPSDLDEAQQRMTENAGSVIDRVQEVSEDGELVVDPLTGVFYDDPEEGAMDDEAGDDENVSFSDVNEAAGEEVVDPESYAPDTIEGVDAPDWGVLADAGDSQNWGSAGEQANDDLTERTANSNLSDERKAMWDRFANRDSSTDSDSDSGSDSSSDGDDTTETISDGSSSSDDNFYDGSADDSYDHQFEGGLL